MVREKYFHIKILTYDRQRLTGLLQKQNYVLNVFNF